MRRYQLPPHPFRTGRGWQSAKDRTGAIKGYCKWCCNGHVSLCTSPLCPLYLFRKGGVDSAQNARSFAENDDIGVDLEEETERGGNNYAPAVKVLRTERQAGNDQGGGAGRASQEFRQKSI
ncbi:MAG: hypothetical protein ABSD38_32880 [Syntrophorhabdales bacterium]|jgi:hypothetical protein